MQTYRFGEFELDLVAGQLRRQGEPVHLEPRPFGLLALLVANAGRLVTREEIVAALWPAKIVIDFDAGVNTLVRKVRHALDDQSAQPRFLETVPGRGYRFVAPLAAPAAVDAPVVAPPPRPAAPAPRRNRRLLAAVAVLVLGGVAAVVASQSSLFNAPRNRIAVLPFDNLTGDDSLGYLAAGLAEDTSITLGRVDLPGLAVIGIVSSRAFVESELALPAIGERFDIDYVVDGSLRTDPNRLRVSARLLRTRDGKQLWSANFDRALTDALGLQKDLSVAIAEQVRRALSPEAAIVIAQRQTRSPQAYDLYLKGRAEWMRFLPGSVDKAIAYYEQAVAIDPGYGLAWAGMAHALTTSVVTVGADRQTALPLARAALERALATDPDLAETQYALAAFRFFLEWDLAGAEAAARQAVDLDPNLAMAWMTLGIVQSSRNKFVEAREAMRRARDLDPLFPLLFANSVYVASSGGDAAGAFELAEQTLAMDPDFWVGYYQLGVARLRVRDYEGALDALNDADRLSGGRLSVDECRGFALAKLGRRTEARAILNRMLAPKERGATSPMSVAAIYAGLGETNVALEWLERAVAERDSELPGLPHDPLFIDLRHDSRFADVLRQAGFPDPLN